MAYDHNNLSAIAYANGFTVWHYKSSDGYEEVTDPGYFNDANHFLRKGDAIFLILCDGNAQEFVMNDADGEVVISYNLGNTIRGIELINHRLARLERKLNDGA